MKRWLVAALIVGLLARLPGVFWGFNWPAPGGFAGHHPDEWAHVANAEVVMNPNLPPRFEHPYPKALGAIVGAPVLALSIAHGKFGGERLAARWTILAGRLVSILFGLGSILLVFLIGRDVLNSERIGVYASWLLALGGLHVTQSHFFVADVPVTTWLLLSLWLMWRDTQAKEGSEALRWAAFFTGAAFAMKLFFFSFPALGLVTLRRGPRLQRVLHVLVFAATGFWISSIGFDTPFSYARILNGGTTDPYVFDRVKGALLYAVQLPGILSLPLLVLSAVGAVLLLRHLWQRGRTDRVVAGLTIFGTVPAITLLFILLMADHFPRHWVPLIPWAVLAGAWALDRAVSALQLRGRSPALIFAPVMLWMAALVVDSERGFIAEPRNDALRWLYANADSGSTLYWNHHPVPPGFAKLRWEEEGNPDYLAIEMYDANNFLSGIDWRNSYPTDPTAVFAVERPQRLVAFQSLFRGDGPYREVARFSEGYVMPEHRFSMWLVGDRARSYLTEVLIFKRVTAESSPTSGNGAP